ncbi:MAG: hypothetical protein ABSE06_14500 [Anaerolineaceae bacterium]|jgi:hypothetical protein
MSISQNLNGRKWKEIREARIIDIVEKSRKLSIVLLSYEGPLPICPTCGGRISDKWTHISDPSGVGCRGFLTKEVREFQEKIF